METVNGGVCPPPKAQPVGLEEPMGQISLSPHEPEAEGHEDAAQEEPVLPFLSDIEFQSPQPSSGRSASNPPYSSSPNSSPHSQRPNVDYSKMFTTTAPDPENQTYYPNASEIGMSPSEDITRRGQTFPAAAPDTEDQTYYPNASEIGMSPPENIVPQGQTFPAYSVAGYIRPRSGTALSQNSAGSYYPMPNIIYESGNASTQSHVSTTQPWVPTGPAKNSQRGQRGRRNGSDTNSNRIKAEDTNTKNLPPMKLWGGKLPIVYVRLAVLTPVRLQSPRIQEISERLCTSPAQMVCFGC